MARKYMFTAVLIPQRGDGGYVAFIPALPGASSEGDTVREALRNIRDAAAGWIAAVYSHDKPIPANRRPNGRTVRRATDETARGFRFRTRIHDISVVV